ncbi:Sodium/hydrogen exchanger 8 [Porphyridium purpureum]|uniref:Sodium/hydrogen exchanger 8 n=1 Tax=Porphyridium purpureum TaxID=35688 RepID=A0A5J4YN06_PORPP|nr:Sodium/hydrogen exchanger 8 [Porphyridium purpureum]|eukprot:POR7690..scf295_9
MKMRSLGGCRGGVAPAGALLAIVLIVVVWVSVGGLAGATGARDARENAAVQVLPELAGDGELVEVAASRKRRGRKRFAFVPGRASGRQEQLPNVEPKFCLNEGVGCLIADPLPDCDPSIDPHSPGCVVEEVYTFVLFPLFAISLGIIVQLLQKLVPWLPYTFMLLCVGAIMGVLGCKVDMAYLSLSMNQWVHLASSSIFFQWFLAPLIFEASFNADWIVFKKLFLQITYAAFVLVFVQVALLATFQIYAIQSPGWNWWAALMFGAMLCATDPIAVTATLKAVGAPETLSTLIEGESQLNDGSAFVLWEAFFENVVEEGALSIGDIVVNVVRLSLGGVAMGLAFGIVAVLLLSLVYEHYEIEVSITIVVAFLGFWTAQEAAILSGVITNVTSGLVISYLGKPFISPRVRHPLGELWELLSWLANTIVFFYAGVMVVAFIWSCAGDPLLWYDYVFILAYYGLLQVLRFLLVFGSYPVYKFKQRWWDWKNATVVAFSGLRGALSLILALEVGESPTVSSDISARVVVWTSGVIALSLALNGTLIKPLIHLLGMDKPDPTRESFLFRARGVVVQQVLDALDQLAVDPYISLVPWKSVISYAVPDCWWAADAESHLATGFANAITDRRASVSMDVGVSRMSRAYEPRVSLIHSTEGEKSSSALLAAVSGETPGTPAATGGKKELAVVRVSTSGPDDDEKGETGSITDSVGGSDMSRPMMGERPSVAVERLHDIIAQQVEDHLGEGDEVDQEIRRRFLESVRNHVQNTYVASLISQRAVHLLLLDLHEALEANEYEEPHVLFLNLVRLHSTPGQSQKLCLNTGALARMDTSRQIFTLLIVVRVVGLVLLEPYMRNSPLVFGEAESLFDAAVFLLEYHQSRNIDELQRLSMMHVVGWTLKLQERILSALCDSGELDATGYDRLNTELVETARKWEVLGAHKQYFKFTPVTAEQVRNEAPLFAAMGEVRLQELMQSYGRVLELTGNERISMKGIGLLLVLEGSVMVDCVSVYTNSPCACSRCRRGGREESADMEGEEIKKAKDTDAAQDGYLGHLEASVLQSESSARNPKSPGAKKKKAPVPGVLLNEVGQIVCHIDDDDDDDDDDEDTQYLSSVSAGAERAHGDEARAYRGGEAAGLSKFHWCFGVHSVIADPSLVVLDESLVLQPLRVCHSMEKTRVLALPLDQCERLMDANETFANEVARSVAHKILTDQLRTESTHKIFEMSELGTKAYVGLSPISNAAFLALKALPYMSRVRIPDNQVVLMQGPAILLRGRVRVRQTGRATGAGMDAEGDFYSEKERSRVLPAGDLSVEVWHGKDDESAHSGPVTPVEILVVPYRSPQENMQSKLQRWNPERGGSILANARFALSRHVDLTASKRNPSLYMSSAQYNAE